jgi:type II secretory pathway pseudopilin PulG
MTADLTTVVVAVLGVAGTLSSPLLAQRIAARAKQQEFSLQSQQRREELQEVRRRQAFEERRSLYASLNTAARQYNQALREYLRMVTAGSVTEDERSELSQARATFRDLYSDAQMILPDRVLQAAAKVSGSLGDAYGMIKRLESGRPRANSAEGTAETFEVAHEYCRVTIYDLITDLRQLMREDLGVSPPRREPTRPEPANQPADSLYP